MEILDALKKAEHPLDQALIGVVRTSQTLVTFAKILNAIRQADLGNDSNAIVDELIVLTGKAQAVVGAR